MPAPATTRIVVSVLPSPSIVGLGGAGLEIINESATDGIVAHAGGTQAAGVLLTTVYNRVITVGTIADSVVLPPALAGSDVFVANAGALSMNVFPASATQGGVAGGDLINGLAQNGAFAMAAGKNAHFFCAVNGKWSAILSA